MKTGRKEKYKSIDDINSAIPEISLITAIEFTESTFIRGKEWRNLNCKCTCGKLFITGLYKIIGKHARISCGCKHRENLTQFKRKYTITNLKLYAVYHHMINRCYKPTNNMYPWYGAKGVYVCAEWRDNYQNFLSWALANGYKNRLCLDKDIKGDGKLYSPDTCCWVTHSENNNHKSTCRLFMYKGKLTSIANIARDKDMSYSVLLRNINKHGESII